MTNAKSMEGFKPCPSCYSMVDVIVVQRHEGVQQKNYFFVNCKSCGEGTHSAFPSIEKLRLVWNQKVESTIAAMA